MVKVRVSSIELSVLAILHPQCPALSLLMTIHDISGNGEKGLHTVEGLCGRWVISRTPPGSRLYGLHAPLSGSWITISNPEGNGMGVHHRLKLWCLLSMRAFFRSMFNIAHPVIPD